MKFSHRWLFWIQSKIIVTTWWLLDTSEQQFSFSFQHFNKTFLLSRTSTDLLPKTNNANWRNLIQALKGINKTLTRTNRNWEKWIESAIVAHLFNGNITTPLKIKYISRVLVTHSSNLRLKSRSYKVRRTVFLISFDLRTMRTIAHVEIIQFSLLFRKLYLYKIFCCNVITSHLQHSIRGIGKIVQWKSVITNTRL